LNDKKTIKHWAEDDRPREKLVANGAASLSNAELLAIIIGTGSGQKSALDLGRDIMNMADNDLVKFININTKQLESIKGIGPAKAISIAAAKELGVRIKVASSANVKSITSTQDIGPLLMNLYGHYNYEIFAIVFLNTANRILAHEIVSEGGLASSIVDLRIIFKAALLHQATGIILCHNHPSGQLSPSQADFKITKSIIDAGKTMDIKVVDHIIVSQSEYYSMGDDGTL
jgi:DNA repair protein RadC